MKTISIVIPVFNEEERIEKTLETLKKGFHFNGLVLEKIIFVDDGSQDGVKEKIAKAQLSKHLKIPVEVIAYKVNKGRGYAVKRGAFNCSSDYILYADADFSIPLKNLKKFVPYIKNDYDLLFGSKKKPGAKETVSRGLIRTTVGYGHSLIGSLLLNVFVWDFQGGFKIFSQKFVQDVFPLLTLDRWGFDMEVIFLAKKLGYKTIELPVVWSHVENGSKVNLIRDIVRALKDMITIRQIWLRDKYSSSIVLDLKHA